MLRSDSRLNKKEQWWRSTVIRNSKYLEVNLISSVFRIAVIYRSHALTDFNQIWTGDIFPITQNFLYFLFNLTDFV